MSTNVVLDEGPVGFAFQGKQFFSLGAFVTDDICTAYLGSGGKLVSCGGQVIGSYRITSTWPTPRSWLSSTMHQVIATVQGRRYTGRSAGQCMVFHGRRLASDRRNHAHATRRLGSAS